MRAADPRALALALALPLCGCALIDALTPPAPPWAEVRGERSLVPPSAPVRRVLVLPFTAHDAVPAHAEALRVAFGQVLRDACGFDVVSPDVAGLPRTTRDELLHGSARDVAALVRLHREWDADAILFGKLAFSRAYGEPGVGLELELVDARDGAKLWDAKDVVDARDPEVRASLLRFRNDETGTKPDDAAQVPFESFTRFVARSFVRTLFAAPPEAVPTPAPGASPTAQVGTAPEVPGKRFPPPSER